jgi:hypothetical protein
MQMCKTTKHSLGQAGCSRGFISQTDELLFFGNMYLRCDER